MKKIAALTLLAAVSAAASAQSSVTLFGVVDVGVRYVKNGDNHQTTESSNGANTSRIGLRGVEDLGDGLKAGFWLESGLNPDSGTNSDTGTAAAAATANAVAKPAASSKFWNRRSTVSLSGGFGEVRLGRDYTPTYLGYTDYDVFGDNGVAASSKFDSSFGTNRLTGTRADNQVTYLTPGTLGGFYARVSVAPGEGVDGAKYAGGRVGFASGPFDVSVNYGRTDVATFTSADEKFKVYGGGAAYDFGVVKLFGYYEQSKLVEQKLATYSIGATAPIGAGLIRAQVTRANATGANALTGASTDANDATQFALGYMYNFSKRTAIYTTAARVNNKGAANFRVANTAANFVAGDDSTGYEIGLRHSF